jgi:hypothetical protein
VSVVCLVETRKNADKSWSGKRNYSYDIRVSLTVLFSALVINYLTKPTTLLNLYAQLELKFGLLRAITPCYQVYDYTILNEATWAKVDKTSEAAKTVLRYARAKTQGYQVGKHLVGCHATP